MKLIINEDNSHFYWSEAGKPAKRISRFIEQYENTGVSEIFLNVNCMRASYDSKVYDPIWAGFDPNGGLEQPYLESLDNDGKQLFYNFAYNAKQLNGEGKNVYCEWIKTAREKNISPWISMRMNDVHNADDEKNPLHSEFWKNHPERRRVNYRYIRWTDKALDYGREDVREHALDLIREIAETFDMDGLELDWMRFGFHFKPGFETEGVKILNQFTRDVRKILDSARQKYGHKIALAARVPSRPETALGLGFDAVTWASEDLIDLLIVTPFWATAETDMPIEIWKQLLRGTKTKLAAGLEIIIRPHGGGEVQTNSLETVRGIAWSCLSRGADAVYLFNYMHSGAETEENNECEILKENKTYREFLKEISDIDKTRNMRGKTRRHIVTYSDTWAPGEPQGYLLPVSLGGWSEFRIQIGETLKNQDAYVIIGVKDGEAPEVYVNGTKCEKSDFRAQNPPIPYETQYSFKIPPDILHDGHNLVETNGGKGKLHWVEIYVK